MATEKLNPSEPSGDSETYLGFTISKQSSTFTLGGPPQSKKTFKYQKGSTVGTTETFEEAKRMVKKIVDESNPQQ
jgi:hypothetical protein